MLLLTPAQVSVSQVQEIREEIDNYIENSQVSEVFSTKSHEQLNFS